MPRMTLKRSKKTDLQIAPKFPHFENDQQCESQFDTLFNDESSHHMPTLFQELPIEQLTGNLQAADEEVLVEAYPLPKEESKPKFDITNDEDLATSIVVYEQRVHPNRMMRLTRLKDNDELIQLKLFRRDYKTKEWKRNEQVTLTVQEADNFMIELPYFRNRVHDFLSEGMPLLPHNFIDGSNWYVDLHGSHGHNRLVRCSIDSFSMDRPLINTYFTIKVFKNDNQQSKLRSTLKLTVQELECLADISHQKRMELFGC